MNHSSSQLQDISHAVHGITQEVCPPPMDESHNSSPAAERPTLLGSLQELITRTRTQEEENAAQRQKLDTLAIAMHEDMRLNTEMRNAYSMWFYLVFILHFLILS